MRTFIIIFITNLVSPLIGFGQSAVEKDYDAVYGVGAFATVESNNPDSALYLTFFHENAFVVMSNVPAEKLASIESTEIITTRSGNSIAEGSFLNKTFNPFDPIVQNDGYFASKHRIGATTNVLICIDQVTLDLMFSDWRKAQ